MAHRRFEQFQGTLEKGVVELYALVTIGASGAPTLTRGKGISSVTRNSAGDYTFAFGASDGTVDKYQRLLGWSAEQGGPLTGPTGFATQLASDDSASGSVNLITSAPASPQTAADPESGRTWYVTFTLSNSSVA